MTSTGGGVGLEDAVVGRGRHVQIAQSPSFLQGFRKCVQFDLELERVHKGGVALWQVGTGSLLPAYGRAVSP